MKSPESIKLLHPSRTLGTSQIVIIVVSITLFCIIQSNKANAPPTPANCIVCNSEKDPICREDASRSNPPASTTTSPPNHLARFEKECKPEEEWCYKSEGRIETVNYTGQKILVWKVDRGCSQKYYNQTCVRVRQEEDETDFRVCYCDAQKPLTGNYCNTEMDVWAMSVVNRNGAQRLGASWFWLGGLGLFYYLFRYEDHLFRPH